LPCRAEPPPPIGRQYRKGAQPMHEDQTYISDVTGFVGKDVTIKGWVYNTRSSGKIRFVLVRDGTGIIQCTAFAGHASPEVFDLADRLTQESSVIVKGEVREDKRAPGGFELGIRDLQLVQEAVDYPITPKEHGIGFLMEHRHLWLRSSKQHAVLRVRASIVTAIRDFYDDRGFVLVDAPIFTPAACEGTSTLFEADYFGKSAYLTQSGQLYSEAAAMAFGKAYCFGPSFRAEKSKTRRHLTEFWQVEPEVAYFDLDDDMKLAEDTVEYVVQSVLDRNAGDLETLGRDTATLQGMKAPFPRITYTEAIKKLAELGEPLEWGEDFGSPHETALSKAFDKPVFVHRYPAHIKAFYMEADPQDKRLALCFDLLAPEGYGEIVGGSQRIHSLELLEERLREHNLPREAFEWYLDLRRYGSVPHAGFGMGLERVVAWICGVPHLRETIPFPRMLDTLYP
jgi:asparaginyl-tRNA synthetase